MIFHIQKCHIFQLILMAKHSAELESAGPNKTYAGVEFNEAE